MNVQTRINRIEHLTGFKYMSGTYSTNRNYRFIGILIFAAMILTCNVTTHAKKIHTAQYGRIYLTSGDSIIADGDLRIGIPTRKKKLEIIENAYTRESRIKNRIDPESVDSVVIWQPTAPANQHTFRFIKEYGWCFQAEKTPFVYVYCYAPKGYYFAGNGGIWMYGKSNAFIVKDRKIYNFGQPHKTINDKIRAKLKEIVSDDPEYANYIMTAKGRRDKILRSLVNYNPRKTTK